MELCMKLFLDLHVKVGFLQGLYLIHHHHKRLWNPTNLIVYGHRRTRRGGWGGCSPPNFERNYHFRAIPIEVFGQFVGLSINFRSS